MFLPRRWQVVPAHHFFAAPAMMAHCRRTSQVPASAIK
jgi:hypothetical protein